MAEEKGFTLVELLVVISIISLLMSILMPALNRTRNMARALCCASNMRQISLGFLNYGQDNDNWIITAKDPRQIHDGERAWNFELIPYMGQKNNEDSFEDKADVFFCPEDKDPFPIGYGSYWHGTAFTSYCLNGCYVKGTSARPELKLGPAGKQKLLNIRQSAECMLIAETCYSYQIYDAENKAVLNYGLSLGGHHRNTSGFYHNKSMNVLFVDGHTNRIAGEKAEVIQPCWDTGGYMFQDNLSLSNSTENRALWGPGYK